MLQQRMITLKATYGFRISLDCDCKRWRYENKPCCLFADKSTLYLSFFVTFSLESMCVFMLWHFQYCFCRLFADITNDLAIFLEIAAPYFPMFFTSIICVAGVCRVRRSIIALKRFFVFFHYFMLRLLRHIRTSRARSFIFSWCSIRSTSIDEEKLIRLSP